MNILLVNSTQSFEHAIRSSIPKKEIEVFTSEGIAAAVKDIQAYNCHIVFINWAKGDFDVMDLCRKIKRLKKHSSIHIIVVAARQFESELPEIMDSGADDFIIRPFGDNEIFARYRAALHRLRLATDLTGAHRKILRLAKEDPITGLLNRRTLMDEMLREMGRAAREMKYLSAILTRITNFRAITEQMGLDIMEGLLEEFSRRLKTSCRPYDMIGRYSMSDFLLCTHNTTIEKSQSIAERIIKNISGKPFNIRGTQLHVEIAVGITALDPTIIVHNNGVNSALMNDSILDGLLKRSEEAVKLAETAGGIAVI